MFTGDSSLICKRSFWANFLEDLHIPLPPLDIQRAIVRQTEVGRAEIARLREQAAHRAQEAQAEVEAAILGAYLCC